MLTGCEKTAELIFEGEDENVAVEQDLLWFCAISPELLLQSNGPVVSSFAKLSRGMVNGSEEVVI